MKNRQIVLCLALLCCMAGCGVPQSNKADTDGNPNGVTQQSSQSYGMPNPSTGVNTDSVSTPETTDTNTDDTLPLRLMTNESMDGDELAALILSMHHLTLETMPYDGDYDTALEARIAANDAPDFFYARITPVRLRQWVEKNAIGGLLDSIFDQYPVLHELVKNDLMLAAYGELYGGQTWYIPRVNDREPPYDTEGTRIFYRKDWAEQSGLSVPSETGALLETLKAFKQQNPGESIAGLVSDHVSRIACWFGVDPTRWLYEEGAYIPAYYAYAMKEPLAYARTLYQEGLLTLGNMTLNDTFMLITNGGTADTFAQVVVPVAETTGQTVAEAYAQCVDVLEPPYTGNNASVWGASRPAEGWFARADISEAVLERTLLLMEYTLSDEARAYARYGLPEITYTTSDNRLHLFTDPETYNAYDLAALYPTGAFLLRLITRDASRGNDLNLPSPVSPALRLACAEATALYYRPAETRVDALSRAVIMPERDNVRVDYDLFFKNIVVSDEPLDDIFERYRAECRRLGVEHAVAAVTEALAGITP